MRCCQMSAEDWFTKAIVTRGGFDLKWIYEHANMQNVTLNVCVYILWTQPQNFLFENKRLRMIQWLPSQCRSLLKGVCCALIFSLFLNYRKVSRQFFKGEIKSNSLGWFKCQGNKYVRHQHDKDSLQRACCACACVCINVCTLYVSDTRKHSGIPGPLEGSSFTRQVSVAWKKIKRRLLDQNVIVKVAQRFFFSTILMNLQGS